MAGPLAPLDVLRRCFTGDEWAWLGAEEAFRQALKALQTLDDVERVSHLGNQLIRFAQHAKEPIRPPPVPRDGPGDQVGSGRSN